MIRTLLLLPLLLLAGLLQAKPMLVVTTTLIATAVQDVSGDAFEIVILMPAGTCPGQFDLDPRQAAVVPRASLLIRHEMQSFLDRLFVAAGARKENIVAPQGSFTVPGAYLAYCEKIATELAKAEPSLADTIQQRGKVLRRRLQALSTELKEKALPLGRSKTVCALFQTDLVSWLGLEVIASFPPAEDPSPAVLREAVQTAGQQGAVVVIGNVQNGERVPETIAQALGLRCVMLSNFPVEAAPGAQDALMRRNLELLLAWLRQSHKP